MLHEDFLYYISAPQTILSSYAYVGGVYYYIEGN